MPKVHIYTTQYCSYCDSAKRFFEQKGWDYKETNLTEKPELRQELSIKHSWRTVPMIFINDEFIGGFTELIAKEGSPSR